MQADAWIVHGGSVGGDVAGFPLKEKTMHGLSCRSVPPGGPTMGFPEDDGGFFGNHHTAESGHFRWWGEVPRGRGWLLIPAVPPCGEGEHENAGKNE